MGVAEVARLSRVAEGAARPARIDIAPRALRGALEALIASFEVYRVYVTPGRV